MQVLLKVIDVADALRVSKQCVYTLIDDGQLEHVRIPPRRYSIRIRPADLIIYLENNKVPRRSAVRTVNTASAPSAFRQLDAARLRRAWREQGIDPHD